MKHIPKTTKNEPASLRKHKLQPHHNYENYPGKDDLRTALLKEQGFLCCYCTRRITAPTEAKMVIEHFRPYSKYEKLRLEWSNLLASCKGGEGGPKHLFHCDETKKDEEITLNPTNQKDIGQLRFSSNGRVSSENPVFQNELDEVLCLNREHLKTARASVVDSITKQIKKEFKGQPVSKSWLNRQLKKFENRTAGQFEPFAQVAIYFLKKHGSKTK